MSNVATLSSDLHSAQDKSIREILVSEWKFGLSVVLAVAAAALSAGTAQAAIVDNGCSAEKNNGNGYMVKYCRFASEMNSGTFGYGDTTTSTDYRQALEADTKEEAQGHADVNTYTDPATGVKSSCVVQSNVYELKNDPLGGQYWKGTVSGTCTISTPIPPAS